METDSKNPRYRLLCVLEILRTESDEQHILSLDDICNRLLTYDIAADKRAVSSDIRVANSFAECIIPVYRPQKGFYYKQSDEFRPVYMSYLAAANSPYYDGDELSRYMKEVRKLASIPTYNTLFGTGTNLDYPVGRLYPDWFILNQVKSNIVNRCLCAVTLRDKPNDRSLLKFSTTRLIVRPVGTVLCSGSGAFVFALENSDTLYKVNFWRIAECETLEQTYPPFAVQPDVAAAVDYFSAKPFTPYGSVTVKFRFPPELYADVISFWGMRTQIEKCENGFTAQAAVRLGYDIIGWLNVNRDRITMLSHGSIQELEDTLK